MSRRGKLEPMLRPISTFWKQADPGPKRYAVQHRNFGTDDANRIHHPLKKTFIDSRSHGSSGFKLRNFFAPCTQTGRGMNTTPNE